MTAHDFGLHEEITGRWPQSRTFVVKCEVQSVGTNRRAKVDTIEQHLGKLDANPGSRDAPHWRGEVQGWIKAIEKVIPDMGKKTGAEWTARVAEWLARLGQ